MNLNMNCLVKKKCTNDSSERKLAIRNLSLAVNSGEVLGLLGHNGAGKTTTMRIITMEEKETTGKVRKAFFFTFLIIILNFIFNFNYECYFEIISYLKVFIKGHDIRESVDIAYRMIGYCPQHDALWSSLTIREHLYVYATIRGISSSQIKKYVYTVKI